MFRRIRGSLRRRVVKIVALVALLAGVWLLLGESEGIADFVRRWHGALVTLAHESLIAGAAAYVLSTAVAKLTPVTGGGVAMILGGYLFGTIGGGLLAAAGAAASALAVAIAGRLWLSELVLDRWGERFARIEHRLLEDGFSYYLALRLLPIVPAWLTNLVPIVVPLPLWQVGLATFVGVLPVSLIAARLGSGIARVAAREEALTARLLIDLEILLPLLALALLALLPPLLRRLGRGHTGS